MTDLQDDPKLRIAVRLSREKYLPTLESKFMQLKSEAIKHGRHNSPREIAKRLDLVRSYYRDACRSVARHLKSDYPGLEHAMCDLEQYFQFKFPNPATARAWKETVPAIDLASELAQVREQVMEEVTEGMLDMSENAGSTTTNINQYGDNPIAVGAGSNSTVNIHANLTKLSELVPAAIREVEGLNLPENDKELVIEHIMSIEDESNKQSPDPSRLKRLAKRLQPAADAALTSGGTVAGASAVQGIITWVSSLV